MHRLLLVIFCLFSFSYSLAQLKLDTTAPQFVGNEVVVEVNDAGEMITMSEEEFLELTGRNFTEHLVNFFNFKKSWEEVAAYITPEMEQEFDLFMIVNVDYEGRQNMSHEIPAQYMKVIERTKDGQKLFIRQGGRVTGIRKDVVGNNGHPALAEAIKGIRGDIVSGEGVLSNLVPVSSGAGHKKPDPQGYVDTPTGIYRINHGKSDVRRYSKGMWNSLYFDLIYPSGRSSGLAIHGTSKSKYWKLGKKQDSHGCIRVKQNVSHVLYENLINDDYFWSDDLLDLNNRKRLKSTSGEVKPGAKALIVIFYGYDNPIESLNNNGADYRNGFSWPKP